MRGTSLDIGANLFFAPPYIRLNTFFGESKNGIAECTQVRVFACVFGDCLGRGVPVSAVSLNDQPRAAVGDKEVANVSTDTILRGEIDTHTCQEFGDGLLDSRTSAVTVAPLQVAGMTTVFRHAKFELGPLGEKLFAAIETRSISACSDGVCLALGRAVYSCALLGQFFLNCKFFAALLAAPGNTSRLDRVLMGAFSRAKLVLSAIPVFGSHDGLTAIIALCFSLGCSGNVGAALGAKPAFPFEQDGLRDGKRLPADLALYGLDVLLALLVVALSTAKVRAAFVGGELFTAVIAMLDCFWHEKAPCRLSVGTLAEGAQLTTRGLESKYSIRRIFRQRYSTLSTLSIAHFGGIYQVIA